MNQDFVDLLAAFQDHEVAHLVVGAFAMAVHGVARSTGDIDVWVRPDAENANRVVAALAEFGAPLAAHGVSAATFTSPGTVYQMGLPPSRIDILTAIDGVTFDEAWEGRCLGPFGDLDVPVLGLRDLRTNKATSGRPKDLADLALLDEALGP
ncbi:MAG: hypothetical protein H6734_28550 [Alphaproteobacteria bacterium]|nr:hypothetical protein [Alphaproteobacteria bacterium]